MAVRYICLKSRTAQYALVPEIDRHSVTWINSLLSGRQEGRTDTDAIAPVSVQIA